MLSWLVDSTTILSILLATMAIVLVGVWWRTRQRGWAASSAVCVALITGLFLLGYFVETDNQRIENAIRDLTQAFKSKDLDRMFSHVSERFHYGSINTKAAFREKVTGTLQRHDVTSVEVWDFIITQEPSREKGTAQLQFRVKPHGNWGDDGMSYVCVADLVLDSDDIWRLTTFKLFHAVGTTPLQIPGYD
jgi:hypothetical protein